MKARFFILAACSLLATSCGPSPQDQATAARAAYEQMDYVAARDHLAGALADRPDDPKLLEMLARIRLEFGDGEGAIAALDRLQGLGKLPADADLLYAEGELQGGKAEAALRRLGDETVADAWRLRALATFMQGDPAKAADNFQRGTAASGPKARLQAAYAIFLVEHGEVAEARFAADAAMKEAPGLLQARLADAMVLQAEGKADAALAGYYAILDRVPDHRPALLGAIGVLGHAGRIDELAPLVERGAAAFPGDREFAYLSARLAAERGDWARVRSILQAVETSIADYPEASGLYAQALLEEGAVEQARLRLASLHRALPGDPMIRRTYASALIRVGDYRQAERVIAPLA